METKIQKIEQFLETLEDSELSAAQTSLVLRGGPPGGDTNVGAIQCGTDNGCSNQNCPCPSGPNGDTCG